MTKPRFDLDPSVAFTILLKLSPKFGNSPPDGGVALDAFLTAWYEDPSTDMYEFGQRYVNRVTVTVRGETVTLNAPEDWHDRIVALSTDVLPPVVLTALRAMSETVGDGYSAAAYDRLLFAEQQAALDLSRRR